MVKPCISARGKSRHGIRPSLHPGGLRCYRLTGYRLWCQQKGSPVFSTGGFRVTRGPRGSRQGFQAYVSFASGGSQGGRPPLPPSTPPVATQAQGRTSHLQVARAGMFLVGYSDTGSFGRIHPRRLWPEAPRRRWSGRYVRPSRAGREWGRHRLSQRNGYVRVKARNRCGYLKDGGCGHLEGAFGRARVAFGTVEAVPQRHGRVPGPGPLDRTGGPVRGV